MIARAEFHYLAALVHSLPLAHLITFRCYGTWLHGDERGSFDKRCNVYDTPGLAADAAWNDYRYRSLKHAPVVLNAERRVAVGQAVRECCVMRSWELHAVAVRTNHIHAVVSVGEVSADSALTALKANATRVMRERNCWAEKYSPWSGGGSTGYLWKEKDVGQAIAYVVDEQGEPL